MAEKVAEKHEQEENILGTEKIGKLMLKFSIPSIISMVVNALYNIVDQIFIGRGVGYLGNGATNVVFPITVVAMALSFMIADGGAAYMSLKLGEKKKDEASKGVANAITMAVAVSILLFAIGMIFLPQLLNLFGCTDGLREYAMSYGRIIVMGLPFYIIGSALNGMIRADGAPKYAMASMVTGAIMNIILDPIFIFVFKWGVAGAAWATVISQIITFVLNVIYIKRFKTVDLNKENIKFNYKVGFKVLSLGVSSFITQMSFVLLISVQNNLLGKYGAMSKYGADIPITVLGIVMKINQILTSIIIGIAVGAQPIIGYNYGAGRFDRVKNTIKTVLKATLTVSTVAFVLFQTIPDKLIAIFGSGDANYMEFACLTFRVYLMLCIGCGLQIPSGIIFQAIGKSIKSAILSLSRQIILLIPGMIILSSMFGIMGILYAGPVADGIAFIISSTLLILEVKNLGKHKKVKSRALIDDTSTDNKLNKNMIITVSREYGSGGRYVGRLIADILGIKFYDKELIMKLAEETGLTEEYIEENEEKRDALSILNNGFYSGLSNSDELFIKESELIKELAEKESCVIIGRCADFILKDKDNVFKVFVYSDMDGKIKRAKEYYGLEKDDAIKEINTINKLRGNHYKHYTGNNWEDVSNYDLSINSDCLGVHKTAEFICNLVKEKEKDLK